MSDPESPEMSEIELDDTMVELVELVHTMPTPGFASPDEEMQLSSSLSEAAIDGTVLFVSHLLTDDDNSVLIKSVDSDPVHLASMNPLVDSGIVDGSYEKSADDVSGFHYYEFPQNLTVYSEQELQIILLEM